MLAVKKKLKARISSTREEIKSALVTYLTR